MSESVLVTGGAGFIGSHLVEQLLADENEVFVVDDLSSGGFDNLKAVRNDPALHLIVDSALNWPMMNEVVQKVDTVYHLAAAVGIRRVIEAPVETITNNVRGTEIVLECCARLGKPLFLASASEVYGKSSDALHEDADLIVGSTTQRRWAYAGTKILEEFLAAAYHQEKGLPLVIGRFFNIVGPRQLGAGGMVLPNFVSQAVLWEPITVYGSGRQTRCFCHVQDAVYAMTRLIQHPEASGQVFNIGSDQEITILELAERVKTRTASTSPIEVIPYDEAYEEGFEDLETRKPDISRTCRLLDWEPSISIDQTIDEVAAFFRELHAK